MKSTKNILLVSISGLLILSSVWANAMYDSTTWSWQKLNADWVKKEARMLYKNKIQNVKEMKNNLLQENKQRREQIKQNLNNFKDQTDAIKDAFSELSEETTEELKVLRDLHQENLTLLKEEFKNTDLTLEERDELKEELEELNNEYAEKVEELVWENEKASNFLEERKELKEQNQELREEQKQSREQFREERKELVNKYKQNYVNKLATAIPRIKDDKLAQLWTKIDTLLEKIEAKTDLSQEKKDELLAQIISLKEIFEEELELRETEEEELNLDELFE